MFVRKHLFLVSFHLLGLILRTEQSSDRSGRGYNYTNRDYAGNSGVGRGATSNFERTTANMDRRGKQINIFEF